MSTNQAIFVLVLLAVFWGTMFAMCL